MTGGSSGAGHAILKKFKKLGCMSLFIKSAPGRF